MRKAKEERMDINTHTHFLVILKAEQGNQKRSLHKAGPEWEWWTSFVDRHLDLVVAPGRALDFVKKRLGQVESLLQECVLLQLLSRFQELLPQHVIQADFVSFKTLCWMMSLSEKSSSLPITLGLQGVLIMPGACICYCSPPVMFMTAVFSWEKAFVKLVMTALLF